MTIMDMSERLIFIIGSPRSGSTLLERMISSHSKVLGGPEPHLLTPLAHLGYYDTVDKAPYDHLRAVAAQREFVSRLPHGEQDYLDALRAYCHILYGRQLEQAGPGKERVLDKTPAYALVLPFISRVFPKAKYIVLTRHPGAIFSSYADSFFEGDWKAAHDFNPIIERYVPAIARFLREKAVPLVHVKYEEMVKNPENDMRRVCEILELPFEPEMIEYGKNKPQEKGLGDPIGVNQHQRPVTSSVHKWLKPVLADPEKEKLLRKMIGFCSPDDLEIWGYPVSAIYEPLDNPPPGAVPSGTGSPKRKKAEKWDRFRIERVLLHKIRKNIHHNTFGKLVKKIRFTCDVLLR